MTALPWTRRRAQHFDALLEGGRLEAADTVDRQTAELLELVGALRAVPAAGPAAEPRPEFVTGLRERLMVAAEAELKPAAGRERDVARLTLTPSRTKRERRVGLALGAAAIVGATTSMAVASQGALPGDALYPLKRAIENAQTGVSVGDQDKGRTILANASGRLDELEELTSSSDPDAGLVAQTLADFSDQFADGGQHLIADYQEQGNEQSIAELHTSAAESLDVLGGLESSVPARAHDALLDAARTVMSLDQQAANLCATAQCGEPILEVPGQLLAGATTDPAPSSEIEAGGELAGTATPTAEAHPGQQEGKGDNGPSAVDPPVSPVTIPSTQPSSSPGGNDAGGGLPSLGTQTSGGQGDHQNGHHGGKGKDQTGLDPVTGTVTDTVNEVVDGVVDGVNGLLNGLSGGNTPSK